MSRADEHSWEPSLWPKTEDPDEIELVLKEHERLTRLIPPVFQSELESLVGRMAVCEAEQASHGERLRSLERNSADFMRRHTRLACRIREEAKRLHGVVEAYLHPSELSFTLFGPSWTPELSAAGASLASQLQHEVVPDLTELVDGGFEVGGAEDGPPGWVPLLR
jgi:hypothetical protein